MLALDTPLAGLPPELPAELAAELAELIDDAQRYADAAQAINTTRAYARDWKQFTATGASATTCSRCPRQPRSSGST